MMPMRSVLTSIVLPWSSWSRLGRMGVGLALGLGLAWAPSCGFDINHAHCSLLSGDATCAALYRNGLLPYCSAGCSEITSPHGNGCVHERPSDECYSPCGQGFTAEELDDCSVDGTGTSTGSTGSTGSEASTGSSTTAVADESTSTTVPACTSDDECAEPTPACVDGQCVPCSLAPDPAAVCEALDPERPLCAGAELGCVACTAEDASACEGLTPVCDATTGTCEGCTRHEQCPDSACHIEEGNCLPTDRVWVVDGDAGGCAAADGSETAPYCTMTAALANVGAGETGTLRVLARSGNAAYSGGFTITGNRVVAIRGLPEERPRFSGGGVGAPITISAGAVAYLEHGRVDGSAVIEAVQVVGAVLHLDGWLVVLNPGGGVAVSNGGALHARNSVIGANGSALVDAQAVRATDASFELRYVTVAGNDSAGTASIACTGGSMGVVADSVVVAIDPASIDCVGLVVEHSAIDSFVDGEGVVLRDAFDPSWFVAPGAGDFHLEPGHPFDDVALWQVGDPPVDLDGDERPDVPDSPDVAGADR
jgi:hypothetical protein